MKGSVKSQQNIQEANRFLNDLNKYMCTFTNFASSLSDDEYFYYNSYENEQLVQHFEITFKEEIKSVRSFVKESLEHNKAVLPIISSQIKYLIGSIFSDDHLSQSFVVIALKDVLGNMLVKQEDLIGFLNAVQPETKNSIAFRRQIVCESLLESGHFAHLIKNHRGVMEIMMYLNSPQINTLFRQIKDNLPNMMESIKDFISLLKMKMLDDTQQSFLILHSFETLNSHLKARFVPKIYTCLKEESKETFYMLFKEKYPVLEDLKRTSLKKSTETYKPYTIDPRLITPKPGDLLPDLQEFNSSNDYRSSSQNIEPNDFNQKQKLKMSAKANKPYTVDLKVLTPKHNDLLPELQIIENFNGDSVLSQEHNYKQKLDAQIKKVSNLIAQGLISPSSEVYNNCPSLSDFDSFCKSLKEKCSMFVWVLSKYQHGPYSLQFTRKEFDKVNKVYNGKISFNEYHQDPLKAVVDKLLPEIEHIQALEWLIDETLTDYEQEYSVKLVNDPGEYYSRDEEPDFEFNHKRKVQMRPSKNVNDAKRQKVANECRLPDTHYKVINCKTEFVLKSERFKSLKKKAVEFLTCFSIEQLADKKDIRILGISTPLLDGLEANNSCLNRMDLVKTQPNKRTVKLAMTDIKRLDKINGLLEKAIDKFRYSIPLNKPEVLNHMDIVSLQGWVFSNSFQEEAKWNQVDAKEILNKLTKEQSKTKEAQVLKNFVTTFNSKVEKLRDIVMEFHRIHLNYVKGDFLLGLNEKELNRVSKLFNLSVTLEEYKKDPLMILVNGVKTQKESFGADYLEVRDVLTKLKSSQSQNTRRSHARLNNRI